MFASKTTEHLAFMSRQLAHLLASNEAEAALQRLADASPERYEKEIGYLRRLFTNTETPERALGPNPYRMLAKLMPAVPESKNDFFRGFVDYLRQSRVVFETYWAGVVGLTWYLAALSLVVIVITLIFGLSVVPSFEGMFAEHYEQLPALTQTVFKFGGSGFPLVGILLALIVALVVWFVAMFHRRIQQIEPLPRWPSWVPMIGRVAEYYNLGLFLNFCRLLMDCKLTPGQAVTLAAKASNQPDTLSIDSLHGETGDFSDLPILAELAIAEKLGNFRAEINHQCEEHIGKMSLILIQVRDQFSLVLKLLLYVFVGTLVVAMYLPIFKMGSVI